MAVSKKETEIPYLQKFNFILQDPSPDDKIGHLFIVNIIFDEKMQMKKSY